MSKKKKKTPLQRGLGLLGPAKEVPTGLESLHSDSPQFFKGASGTVFVGDEGPLAEAGRKNWKFAPTYGEPGEQVTGLRRTDRTYAPVPAFESVTPEGKATTSYEDSAFYKEPPPDVKRYGEYNVSVDMPISKQEVAYNRRMAAGMAAGGGRGGKKPAGPNTGLDINKQLSFLPSELQPDHTAYLGEDYLRKLENGYQAGLISEEDFGKAMDLVRNYFDKSQLGTQLGAARADRDYRHQVQLDEAAVGEMQAANMMKQAKAQYALADKLENSGILFQAAERRKKKEIQQQIGTIRNKIERLENEGAQPFGDKSALLFAFIGQALSGVGSALAGQKGGGGTAGIMGVINQRMAQQAQMRQGALKFGISAETGILDRLRADLNDDRAAFHAMRGMMIKSAQQQILAMGTESSSQSVKMRAQQVSGQLALQAKSEEAKLIARITDQAEQAKLKRLAGGRARIGKIKDGALKVEAAGGQPYSDPVKGYSPVQYEDNGQLVNMFLPDEQAKEFNRKITSLDQMKVELDNTKKLLTSGQSFMSAAARQQQKGIIGRYSLAASGYGKGGALDKGLQEVTAHDLPEVVGFLESLPVVGGEHKQRLAQAEQNLAARRQTIINNAMGAKIPGYQKEYLKADGTAGLIWVRPGAIGPGLKAHEQGGQRARAKAHSGYYKQHQGQMK